MPMPFGATGPGWSVSLGRLSWFGAAPVAATTRPAQRSQRRGRRALKALAAARALATGQGMAPAYGRGGCDAMLHRASRKPATCSGGVAAAPPGLRAQASGGPSTRIRRQPRRPPRMGSITRNTRALRMASSREEVVIAPAELPGEQDNEQRIAYRRVVRREPVLLERTSDVSGN